MVSSMDIKKYFGTSPGFQMYYRPDEKSIIKLPTKVLCTSNCVVVPGKYVKYLPMPLFEFLISRTDSSIE